MSDTPLTPTCTLHPEGSPVRPGEPFTEDQCRVCWLAAGGNRKAKAAPQTPKRGVCIHLGVLLTGNRQRPCGCLYECEVGAAAAAKPGGNCQTCKQWEPADELPPVAPEPFDSRIGEP